MKKIEEIYTSATYTIETENDFDYEVKITNRFSKDDVAINLTAHELADLITTIEKGADEEIITFIGEKVSFIGKLDRKQETIDKINAIVEEWGSFSTGEVEADHSPVLNSSGGIVTLADHFNVDVAGVEVNDTIHDVVLNSYDVDYLDFDQEALDEILGLAKIYEAQQIEENEE